MSNPIDQSKPKYTDDQLLGNCFNIILNKTLDFYARTKSDPSYWWHDGFEEPIDENCLCPFIYDLAKRLGYKLEKGMWVQL